MNKSERGSSDFEGDLKIQAEYFTVKPWLKTREAAKYLGISITQIHVLKREGILPYSKLGGTIYFKKEDIDQILENNKSVAL